MHLSFEIVALGFSAHEIWFVSSAHCASVIQFDRRGFPDFSALLSGFLNVTFLGKAGELGFWSYTSRVG